MKLPSDAQARLLRLVAETNETIEWLTNAEETYWRGHRPSVARLLIERVDRERDTAQFVPAVQTRAEEVRLSTLRACLKASWLGGEDQMRSVPARRYVGREYVVTMQTWWLKPLELTEDGRIALGVWSERKLNAGPAPLPQLDDRQREIVQLAQRALDLGYALCAREPARTEARRMRKDGWWDDYGCWVANSATGLVPSASAVAAALPERADEPMTPLRETRSPFDAATKGDR